MQRAVWPSEVQALRRDQTVGFSNHETDEGNHMLALNEKNQEKNKHNNLQD